jgi:hypothetical protein
MPDASYCTCSDVHIRAICDEVGDRLRILLDRSHTPPPHKMQILLLQLRSSELEQAEGQSSFSTAA